MTSIQHRVCLLLGSNIEPEKNIRQAIEQLRSRFFIVQISKAWETPAWGTNGPNFLNVAVMINTSLDPYQLKTLVLRPLEAQLKRERSADKFAPRTIDIDIVAWDAEVFEGSLWDHAYLAVPVAEVLPCYQSDETGEYLEQAAQRLRRASLIWPRPEVLGKLMAAIS
jgi:2-amino-4-hydroxy-6-hydroxymethyldihydropteridine diphosphokinase